jgi:hypothetical protein
VPTKRLLIKDNYSEGELEILDYVLMALRDNWLDHFLGMAEDNPHHL